MIHPNASDTATVRSVFIIGPDNKVKLTLTYPASDGAELPGDPARARLAPVDGGTFGCDAGGLEAGRGRDHRTGRVGRGRREALPRLHHEEAVPSRDAAAGEVDPRLRAPGTWLQG